MPAKKSTSAAKPVAPEKSADPKKIVAKTGVRNSPIPRAAKPVAAREITREMIAEHAYFIWTREGGSEYDNWVRAERELRGV